MIKLHGRTVPLSWPAPLGRHVWVLSAEPDPTNPGAAASLVENDQPLPADCDLAVIKPGVRPPSGVEHALVLPEELGHLRAGDVIGVSGDGTRLEVLWRCASQHNSILLTEQCDNYCLMCSQPPKPDDDSWLLDRAAEVISLLPPDTNGLTFTGGEPTLSGARFLELLALTSHRLPAAEIHILSNGRRFADFDFAATYAAIQNPRVMVGIPLYGAEPSLHDYVVQARGAFDDTVRGILNLALLEQRIEVRVVLHRQTAPAVIDIAEFIARNLPFVEQVALMGLEMMGLARGNIAELWIDPFDYRQALSEAAFILDAAGLRTMIYNHQLCLLEPQAWRFAIRSISDWKNEYDAICDTCHVRSTCGGFFHSAKYRSSGHIHPIDPTGAPLPDRAALPAIAAWQRRA